jgi:hypothetical protein
MQRGDFDRFIHVACFYQKSSPRFRSRDRSSLPPFRSTAASISIPGKFRRKRLRMPVPADFAARFAEMGSAVKADSAYRTSMRRHSVSLPLAMEVQNGDSAPPGDSPDFSPLAAVAAPAADEKVVYPQYTPHAAGEARFSLEAFSKRQEKLPHCIFPICRRRWEKAAYGGVGQRFAAAYKNRPELISAVFFMNSPLATR